MAARLIPESRTAFATRFGMAHAGRHRPVLAASGLTGPRPAAPTFHLSTPYDHKLAASLHDVAGMGE
jgi:hypothetical protein